MKSLSKNGNINLRSRTHSGKSSDRNSAKNNSMTKDTKGFIQKICYRKTASIDMTQYGFINDSKANPVTNYVLKPLRENLEKICVKSASAGRHRRTSATPPRAKALVVDSPTEETLKPCTPKSAMSYPGTRSSRSCFLKVRIQSDPSPVPAVIKEQKVRLVSPRRSKGANVDRKKGVRPTKRNVIK